MADKRLSPASTCSPTTLTVVLDAASPPLLSLKTRYPRPLKNYYFSRPGYIAIFEDYILRGFWGWLPSVLEDLCQLSRISPSQLAPFRVYQRFLSTVLLFTVLLALELGKRLPLLLASHPSECEITADQEYIQLPRLGGRFFFWSILAGSRVQLSWHH